MLKISIITTVYNNGSTIEDTIKSVLAQDYPNIEHVIVDGGSTDNTSAVIAKYRDQIGQYVSEPDKGPYDGMNKGVRMATGDVVGILNSDDFFTAPNIVSQLAAAFEEYDCDAVYGDVHYVRPENLKKIIRYYSSRYFRPSWMRLGFMPAHPSFYCKRSIYLQHGLFDTSYKVAADFEQLLRLIYIHRIKTHYLPLDCVTMRIGGLSSSGVPSHLQIFKDHKRALKTNGVRSNSFLLALRYIYKAGELLVSKIRY